MALNATTLGAAMISAAGITDVPGQVAMNNIAAAIISHFIANASIVIAGGAVATGVTAGGAAVPVTGTATLT